VPQQNEVVPPGIVSGAPGGVGQFLFLKRDNFDGWAIKLILSVTKKLTRRQQAAEMIL
jgi:hypothetical protein